MARVVPVQSFVARVDTRELVQSYQIGCSGGIRRVAVVLNDCTNELSCSG